MHAQRHWQRPSWFALALTALGIVLFASLGLWQLDRTRQKRALLEAGAAALSERRAAPLAQSAWDSARAHAYDWAEGAGAFADRPPVLLDNQVRSGRVGVRVYRVFQIDKADRSIGGAILVDLGWLPFAANRELPKLQFPLMDRIEVRGLLAPPPATGWALGPGVEMKDDVWLATRIDPSALAPQLLTRTSNSMPALAPRVLRLDPALPLGFERDLDVLPGAMPPERHLGYAVQWFALALAALATFVLLHFRKVEKPVPP